MWVLASGSPRRSEWLRRLGAHFLTDPSRYEENNASGRSPAELVVRQATAKAREVYSRRGDGLATLGCDTIVWADRAYGKPVDRNEAEQFLRQLGGGTHEVWTGLALFSKDGKLDTRAVRTRVVMETWPEELLQTYLAGDEWTDKAGAYGIQGTAALVIPEIHGSYSNVVGLPVYAVRQLFREGDVDW